MGIRLLGVEGVAEVLTRTLMVMRVKQMRRLHSRRSQRSSTNWTLTLCSYFHFFETIRVKVVMASCFGNFIVKFAERAEANGTVQPVIVLLWGLVKEDGREATSAS